jgi:hypothetical protein
MATPTLDTSAPNPGSVGGWGPEMDKTRENIQTLMLFAAAVGNDLPDWNTSFTYGGGGGELTEVVMIYQTDTSIKMKWVYTYSGSPAKINTVKWYFDKGLGAGYELYTPKGTKTYVYSGDQLTNITAS